MRAWGGRGEEVSVRAGEGKRGNLACEIAWSYIMLGGVSRGEGAMERGR